jgi:class 3 adenylate cyclase
MIQVRERDTGKMTPLLVEFGPDGALSITDASADLPGFEYKCVLESFPTDEVVCAAIGKMLGGTFILESTLDRNVELESAALAGLKKMPVDVFDRKYLDEVKNEALILCVDIRNFSIFLRNNLEETVFSLIKDFTSNFLSCVNQMACGCSYYKLLGDGAIVIWDSTNAQSVFEALSLFDTYLEFVNDELFKPYPGLGLAGALVMEKVLKYEISAESSQLKYRDYVGYGINLSCRLQGIAPKNLLIINHKLAGTGLLPFRVEKSRSIKKELRLLKGMKEEDCGEVLIYKPDSEAGSGSGI